MRNISFQHGNTSNVSSGGGFSTPPEIEKLELINIVVKSTEATSITITNLFVIFLYFCMKRKARNSIANYLIFSQSLADLFVGLLTWVQICMQVYTVDSYNHESSNSSSASNELI